MKRTIAMGHFATIAEHASKMIFLIKVWVFVSLIASPKHPQSFTGFANAIQMVIIVIITIKAKTIFEIILRLMAKRRKTPSESSRVASSMEAVRVAKSGTNVAIPRVSR